MNHKQMLTALALLSFSLPAFARGGGGGANRPETITCGLYFAGNTAAQAPASQLVENSAAVLRGNANGVDYVFSVRGKTAVAKLTNTVSGQSILASGAIEMLRGGGGGNAIDANLFGAEPDFVILRRGEDDANDGTDEKEAGFELSIATPGGGLESNAKLKCISTNQTGN